MDSARVHVDAHIDPIRTSELVLQQDAAFLPLVVYNPRLILTHLGARLLVLHPKQGREGCWQIEEAF